MVIPPMMTKRKKIEVKVKVSGFMAKTHETECLV
jgi:hypothetical protein